MTLPARVKIYDNNIGRTIVICPQCGENNSNTFRFCGMCGTLLEARRPANATAPNPSLAAAKIVNKQDPQRPAILQSTARSVVENDARPVSRQLPPIAGPSMLGLNQTDANPSAVDRPSLGRLGTDQLGADRPSMDRPSMDRPSMDRPEIDRPGLNEPGLNQPASVRPALDSVNDRAFTGLESFFEPEEPRKNGPLRILLLVVLLAALAAAGWWTYGYLDNTVSRRSEAATGAGKNLSSPSGDTQNITPNEASNKTLNSSLNDNPSAPPPVTNASPPPDAEASQTPASSTAVPTPSDNGNARPDSSRKDGAAEAKPAGKATPANPKVALRDKSAPTPKSRVTPARASKPSESAATDSGTADFQKGEAYLYGRGAPENCDQAVKYLKSASAKSSAKAKSAFGTMYATGHCVARDLPTSYLWFAMALRVDPNNQILEKDLSAVWNQMTPPERQLATRMKQ